MNSKDKSGRVVLIIGSDNDWGIEGSYKRAFVQLGWTVHGWDPLAALHRAVRGGRFGRIFSSYLSVEPWVRKANFELVQLAQTLRPDLTIVIGTDGVRAGTLGQFRAQLPDCLIYCLFPDTPHNLLTERILALPFFDRVLTVSPGWMDAFRRAGAKRVDYLPPAADPVLHRPLGASVANGDSHDLSFIGIWRPDREQLLEQLTDFDLCIWGSNYWKSKTKPGSPLRSRWAGHAMFGTDFVKACRQSRILLNIIDGVGWPGPNMRTFEQPACRAFSLVTRTPAVLDIFTEGTNIECFENAQEAREKISFYLSNESERARIANAGYDFVINEGHTYVDRSKQIQNWAAEDGLS